VKRDGRRRPRAQREEEKGESVTTRNTLSNLRSKKTGRGNEKKQRKAKKRKMDETRLDVRREEWEWE